MVALGGDMGKRIAHEWRVSACTGKWPFKTHGQAAKAAKRGNRVHQDRFGQQHPYRCPACGAFHLGATKPKPRALPRMRRVEEEEEFI